MGEPNLPGRSLIADEIRLAARALDGEVTRTPVAYSRALSEAVGVPVWLKCENLQRTGSFKIRGAYYRMSRLTAESRARGVVAASAGNHAQGVALAAARLGIPATVYMPTDAALPKVAATSAYGAEVRLVGDSVAEALVAAEAEAAATGKVFIHPFDHTDIVELRSLADAEEIVSRLGEWRRVAIIGGGFIGLEAASLLSQLGIVVDVVEMGPRLIGRAVSPGVSAWFHDFHVRNGVRIHMPEQVLAIQHVQGHARAMLGNGSAIAADAILLAAGVVPNTDIAANAGLEVENGIIVDALLATSDPAISAIGDCAIYPSVHASGPTRLESVQNAGDHARALAARLTGEGKPYDALPWVWSVQGEARLQIAGLTKPGLTQITRGDPSSGRFSVFLFDGQRLQVVESVNAPGDHMAARRLISQGIRVNPRDIADMSLDIKSLLS